jgi:hypothetical protein
VTARRVALGCGVAALVVVLVGGCAVAAVISELPSGEHPHVDFQGAAISSARAEKISQLEARLAEVERRFGAEHVGPLGRVDRCEAGQDNFTRQDTYAYACRIHVFQVLPVREPVAGSVSRLGEALLAGACPVGTHTARQLARHFGDPERVLWSSGDCTPGTSTGGPQIVTVVPADPAPGDAQSVETFLRTRCDAVTLAPEHCEASPPALRSAAAVAPPGTAALAVVAASDSYYLIPWECPWPASWFRERCGGSPVVR